MRTLGIILLMCGGFIALAGLSNFHGIQMIVGGLISFLGSQIYSNNKEIQSAPTQNKPIKGKFELTDEMIIRLARKFENKLSVDDLSAQTSLTREQAKQRLEKLHEEGICQINLDKVAESGKIHYIFS